MMKTFVLDTNILLDDPRSFLSFKNNQIIIPYEVLLELENQKNRYDLVGKNARTAIRLLESYREKGCLTKGVSLENGGILKVSVPQEKDAPSIDMTIINIASQQKAELITNDISMRLRAESHNIPSSSFRWTLEELDFRDRAEVYLTRDQKKTLFSEKSISLDEKYYPNEFLITDQAIGLYDKGRFCLLQENMDVFGIHSRSKEQTYALHVLMDQNIPLVSLTGKAGCGKTLLAMASALEQTIEKGVYDKIIISRPIQPMGKDIGYLPGSVAEKLNPWIQPLRDSLMLLMKGNTKSVSHLFELGTIEIQALTYIRGRSLPRVFMIVDESQNLSRAEIKAIVTRMGEGSKIVFTGDLNQIDSSRSDKYTNGLFYLIDRMKEQPLSAHVNLIKGERSGLASLAADIL